MKNKGLVILVSIFLSGCVLCVNKTFFAQSSCELATPVNFAPNPGFEDDLDGNGRPDDWTMSGPGTFELDFTEKWSGVSSLKLEASGWFKLTTDYIQVNPEFKYKLSYYAKGSASGFNLTWVEYDENNVETFIYSGGIRDAHRQNELTDQWQQIDNIVLVPLDRTKNVKFYVEVDNGTVWIDDVSAVALTRARILHTVIYDSETFTVDLQTGGDHDVAAVYVELTLQEWDTGQEQWVPVPDETETIDLGSQNNYTHAFPADGMEQHGVGKYNIVATFKCHDNDTAVYEEEFPVYVVEQPKRTEGGVFRNKKEIIDETDNTTSVIFDPYFPVFFGKTNTDGMGMDLLKSKGIYDLSGGYVSMIDPEGDLIDAKGMHAPVKIGYRDDYDNASWLVNNGRLHKTHNKPSLLWWFSIDEPFWKDKEGKLFPVSDMIKAYYTIRTTFDGEKCEAIPLALNEEVLYPNPSSSSYTDDPTREDIIAYTNATDIVMDDEYAVVRNRPLSRIAEVMVELTKHSRGVKPPMIWLTCGWQTIQPKVTPAAFRAQTYMALVHGAKGIGYYSFSEPTSDNSTLWFLPRDNPALWTFMGDFMQELDMVKNIFLQGEDSDAVSVTTVDNATDEYGYEGAHYSAKTYDNNGNNEAYVFIVNGFDEDIEATVDGPGTGDSLTIDLPPQGVVFLVAKDTVCPTGTVCYQSVDQIDPCNSSAWCAFDKDNDTIPDFLDNCASVSNPSQGDTDEDGLGDLCDSCNNDSSCCEFTDTATNHMTNKRAYIAWWIQPNFYFALNDGLGEDDIFCVGDNCSDDNLYSLKWSPEDEPVYYFVGTCEAEDLVGSDSCKNGMDDDNDYLIDCNDPDCDNQSDCIDADSDGYAAGVDCDDDNATIYQLLDG